MQVELKKGETIMIDVALHLPAACLREAFSNRSGLPPDNFELYYRGKRLEGEAALWSWGIEKDSAIEVKMRGRGGAPDTSSDGGGLGTRRPAAKGEGGTAGSSRSDSDDGVGGAGGAADALSTARRPPSGVARRSRGSQSGTTRPPPPRRPRTWKAA